MLIHGKSLFFATGSPVRCFCVALPSNIHIGHLCVSANTGRENVFIGNVYYVINTSVMIGSP